MRSTLGGHIRALARAQAQAARSRAMTGSGQHLASVLQEGWENANIDAGLGFIWRILGSGRNRHATPFCISKYLRNRPRVGGTTSQGAKLVGCHVKIASSGAKRKPNPKISGLPKAGERTKTQRFKKKGVLEGLHEEIGGLYRVTGWN